MWLVADWLPASSHAPNSLPLTDLEYRYDVDGQLTAIDDLLEPSKSKGIAYDDLNRLVQVAEGISAASGGTQLPIEDYAYDEEGNRVASHLSALYASNDHNQLTEDDEYTYAYDEKGNRTAKTAKVGGAIETYTYDSQNRMVGYVSDTTTASYAYDAMERRIAKTLDGNIEAFVYDVWSPYNSIANDVALDFEDGALVRRWLHGSRVDEPLAVGDYVGTSAPLSGSVRPLYADRLGSIVKAISVATGSVASEVEYDSFGARNVVVGAEAESPRYGFTGREHDPETGLIYFRARHFDPATGQFVQRDPIGFAAGDLNLYAYVWNDPVNWGDPSGLAGEAAANSSGSASLARIGSTAVVAGTACLAGRVGSFLGAAGNLLSQGADLSQISVTNDYGCFVNASAPAGDGDDPSSDRPAPPPPLANGCDPSDPDCVDEDECYPGEDEWQETLDHPIEELLDEGPGFDWQKVVREGVRYFDTWSGNDVYVSGNKVAVMERGSTTNRRSTFTDTRKNINNKTGRDGRWKKC